MHSELKENFKKKLRLTVSEIINDLDVDIKAMLAKHAAKGMLRSGNTIKQTMSLISEGNSRIFKEAIEHLKSLNLANQPEIESDIQSLVTFSQESYRIEILPRFKKITEIAGKPQLYERILPEIDLSMENDLEIFQNQLNVLSIQLKLSKAMPQTNKLLWGIQSVLLLISMFITYIWYKDPTGNYEPIVIGLGLVVSLLAICIAFSGKKLTKES